MSCKSSYRTAILRAILLLGVMMAGCELLDPQPGDVSSEEEPQEAPTCNAVEYKVNVSGLGHEGHYLWLGVMQADTVVAFGRPIRLSAAEVDTHVTAQVGFWHGLAEGSYTLRVFESADSTDVGNQWNRSSAAEAGRVQLEALVEDHSCCTPAGSDIARLYCELKKPITGTTGVRARITARYGKLCGAPDSSNAAFSIAVISASRRVSNPQGSITLWGQVGVGVIRDPALGHGNVQRPHVYVEVFGPRPVLKNWYSPEHDGVVDGQDPPADGECWSYQTYLDTVDGIWYLTFGGGEGGWSYITQPDTDGFSRSCDRLSAYGEIINWEDDMPGTVGQPCVFDSIGVSTMGSEYYELVTISTSDAMYSDRPDLWHIERPLPWQVRIWDLDPAP